VDHPIQGNHHGYCNYVAGAIGVRNYYAQENSGLFHDTIINCGNNGRGIDIGASSGSMSGSGYHSTLWRLNVGNAAPTSGVAVCQIGGVDVYIAAGSGSTTVNPSSISEVTTSNSGSISWIPGYYNSNGSTSNQYLLGGTSYDGNGNLTNDTFNAYTWDADGNITTVKGTVTNTYDAFDQLVETSVGPTQFLYLPGGTQPFATMSKYNSYLKVFAPAPGGAMIITPNGTYGVLAYHRHTDWLGSSRFATTPSETVYFDGAYAPFGEPYATSGTTDLVFGGNAQDASLVEGATAGDAYDTPNRKYSASQSRWISPDPSGLSAVDPSNPQSWNRYVYVLNNPLSNIDPLGLYCAYPNDAGDGVQEIDDDGDVSGCQDNGGYWISGSFGGGSWVHFNVDSGTVTGLGYDSSGNAEVSLAGAAGSNVWGAWTQTFAPGVAAAMPNGNNSSGSWPIFDFLCRHHHK
jgi:RHS repeat-associated protein